MPTVYASKAPYIYIDEEDYEDSHYHANNVDLNSLSEESEGMGSGLVLRVHRNQCRGSGNGSDEDNDVDSDEG